MKDNNYLFTICITCYNDSDFILNTLYCLRKITKNKYKVIIRDNNSKLKNYLKLKRGVQAYSNVELYRVDNFDEYGSRAHGIALNDLVNKIDTKYGVILDADCTFLHNDWDEILINELDEMYPIIGTQIDINTTSDKPLDFPCIVGILFDTSILQNLNIDFRPNFEDPKNFKDTAYQLHEKFTKNGYRGKLLNYKFLYSSKNSPFKEVVVPEFYLEGYNEIFASHFGRGSSLGRTKYMKKRNKEGIKGRYKIRYMIPVIGDFLVKNKGKKEKKKWIKICRRIINAQLN